MKPKILFLAANPRDTDQLALDRECRAIQRELRMTAGRDDFEFHSSWAVSVDDLMRDLNELSPTIVHFSGHGTSDTECTYNAFHRDVESLRGSGILLDGQDRSQHVSDKALAAMIANASPSTRLVVLNACHSAAVAESLRNAIDCVIGFNGAVDDTVARSFAVAFYRALGHRRSVGNAVAQAAATLAAKQQSDHMAVCRTRDGLCADELFLSVLDTSAPAGTHEPAQDGYDLFLSHPSANKATATALFDLLLTDVRVFLAGRSLQPSDEWDQDILTAQRGSRATVLLVSRHADAAWYLGDEVITAIGLHRGSRDEHRLIPVLLEPGVTLPLSMSRVAALNVTAAGGLACVADRLRKEAAEMRRRAPQAGRVWEPARSGRTNGIPMRRDHFVLYERLGQLTNAVFEQIVSRAGIEGAGLVSRSAALTARALDVAQLAALDPALSRRVSMELDRRAPWTRR